MDYKIEVGYLDGMKDALGDAVKKDIEDLGINQVEDVKTELLYRIEGDFDKKQVEVICKNLLSDPVIQWYKIINENGGANIADGNGACVDVFFKLGVTDAVGDSVKLGIRDLGIEGAGSVNTGFRYRIAGKVSGEDVEKICRSLLANNVIQDYTIKK